MFCYQCEQTFRGAGCIHLGVCGKEPVAALLQDLLVVGAKGIAQYLHEAGKRGVKDINLDRFVTELLFATGTNVNFDASRLADLVRAANKTREDARELYEQACAQAGEQPEALAGPAVANLPDEPLAMLTEGKLAGLMPRFSQVGADITGLQECALYGLKGAAAYVWHASRFGHEDSSLYASFAEFLSLLAQPAHTAEELLDASLRIGELNLRAMALLDTAHTSTLGHPEPTAVRVEPRQGKAILVTGHDLAILLELLRQTEGKGIQVYTHGEMLPGHGYPALKAFPHLAGNYGGAWMNQAIDFDLFPGAILVTSNCIQQPMDSYRDRLFTCGPVAWPAVRHIADSDYAPVIEAALAAPGFTEDGSGRTITVGFGHNAVLGHAETIVNAVKSGAIRHFFLVGGCDGARLGRNYYTDLVGAAPEDCVVLTLACGKYRFNQMELGEIGGLPRLIDIGQCNDAYSAIRIVTALAEAFQCGVNDLPVSLILSWYEQKAVAILLTLLHLGVKNIRLGPSLPAFLSPSVRRLLAESYNLQPIRTPAQDLAEALGEPAPEPRIMQSALTVL